MKKVQVKITVIKNYSFDTYTIDLPDTGNTLDRVNGFLEQDLDNIFDKVFVSFQDVRVCRYFGQEWKDNWVQRASEQRQSALTATRFEIYTKNPETGETGWNIENVNVYSEKPLEMIRTFPNFDCIITRNDWFGDCSFVMYDLDELKAFEPK